MAPPPPTAAVPASRHGRIAGFLRRHPVIWFLLMLGMAFAASACLHFAADVNTVVYQAF